MSDIIEQINRLKNERSALIIAHNYVLPEVQDIADFVGDSLELSLKANASKSPCIVFCGVSFMAETAKILSPGAIVLHPNPDAGCPMSDMATAEKVAAFRAAHPDTCLVAYVNSSAAVKALVDICCTSANAEKIVNSIPANREIMFLPDRNLGANIAKKLNRPMLLWPGFCPTHHRVTPAMIKSARVAAPDALVLIHPEAPPETVAEADFALSTGGMLRFVRESSHQSFIIGTESGIIHRLKKENPNKIFFPVMPEMLCPNMKKISLRDVLKSLETMTYQVEIPEVVMNAARQPILKMLEFVS
jgi:quinolinate synthase